MPYRDPAAARLSARERQRRRRAKLKAEAAKAPVVMLGTADPVGGLAAWAAATLRVPPGIRLRGRRWRCLPSPRTSCGPVGARMSRRCASLARTPRARSVRCSPWGILSGRFGTPGWRGAIASVSKEKAAELRGQVAAIAEASGLDLRIRRAPYPGKIESATGALEVLSSDRTAGHSSSFDLVIVDETGLLPERSRELLAGLRSSVSGKGGRIVHISVRGDSPLFAEVLANPATVAHVYAAPEGAAIDDESAWAAANPGLGTIKQRAYLRAEVERIRGAPGDEPSFRAFDLNLNLDPTREMILSPDDLRRCFTDDPPPREGRCFLGFDFGEATSSTAACAVWPATGRMETWQSFGDTPSLVERQRAR